MHGQFHISDFIIPQPQLTIEIGHSIKHMIRTYKLPSGYVINKLGVCLNPVPVYSFYGKAVVANLCVAQFLDGKLSFDVHFEVKGESYNGYAASYQNRQAFITVKSAVKTHLLSAVDFVSQSVQWIESEHKKAIVSAEVEQMKEDINQLFVTPQQISLF